MSQQINPKQQSAISKGAITFIVFSIFMVKIFFKCHRNFLTGCCFGCKLIMQTCHTDQRKAAMYKSDFCVSCVPFLPVKFPLCELRLVVLNRRLVHCCSANLLGGPKMT